MATATACPLPTTPVEGEYVPPPIGCPAPAIIYPKDSANVSFYWVPMLDQDTMDALRRLPDVLYAYYYEQRNHKMGLPFTAAGKRKPQDRHLFSRSKAPSSASEKLLNKINSEPNTDPSPLNGTVRVELPGDKRQENFHLTRNTPYWGPSQVSMPKNRAYSYHYDSVDAKDTYVYLTFEGGIWEDGHDELDGSNIEHLAARRVMPDLIIGPDAVALRHGAGVAAQVVGKSVGICPTCTLIMVKNQYPNTKVFGWISFFYEEMLSHFQNVLLANAIPPAFLDKFRELLEKLDTENVVLVAVASNDADKLNKDKEPIYQAGFSNYSPFITAFAPGDDVHYPKDPERGKEKEIESCDSTSFSAPQVAALANYFRAVPSRWQSQLNKPANIKKLIQLFARRFAVAHYGNTPEVKPEERRPIIWNGRVGEHSCLRDFGSEEEWAKVYPSIKDNLEDEPENPGQPVDPCGAGQNGSPARRRRQDGGAGGGSSCPYIPGDNNRRPGKTIDWEEGPSAPECGSNNNYGGELCKGYYYDPDPEVPHPPDCYDPKDPENPHGQPPPEEEEPPTEPLVETFAVCFSRSVTSPSAPGTPGYYAWEVYSPGLHYSSDVILGSIEQTPDICKVPDNNESFDFCGTEFTFVNKGPEVFPGCGFQIEIDGNEYSPHRLDSTDDNQGSGNCGRASYTGLLLYELPHPRCEQELNRLWRNATAIG
ncbi:hypothetical protein ASPCAL01540 [Aspergillus calidoustus]|uniref:Peptidase S8/S53 domain-containing protein n=1 Tax=Aspergillus calidoustus TaxID=454130 RepID=A0A0U5C334_ASPCI|nr:hypothetical protein ASPCAL01540 [Aspergillus calidoustus]